MIHRIEINQRDLGRDMRKRLKATTAAIELGLRIGAERGRTYLVMRTPVDTGFMKNSWRVMPTGKSVGGLREYALVNSAPYAGIIEAGARPHPVSRQGVEAIAGWVRRKIGGNEQAVKQITWAIVHKLKTKGQKATWFVKKASPTLVANTKAEVERIIATIAGERMK